MFSNHHLNNVNAVNLTTSFLVKMNLESYVVENWGIRSRAAQVITKPLLPSFIQVLESMYFVVFAIVFKDADRCDIEQDKIKGRSSRTEEADTSRRITKGTGHWMR
jgi:hypothetical protein